MPNTKTTNSLSLLQQATFSTKSLDLLSHVLLKSAFPICGRRPGLTNQYIFSVMVSIALFLRVRQSSHMYRRFFCALKPTILHHTKTADNNSHVVTHQGVVSIWPNTGGDTSQAIFASSILDMLISVQENTGYDRIIAFDNRDV